MVFFDNKQDAEQFRNELLPELTEMHSYYVSQRHELGDNYVWSMFETPPRPRAKHWPSGCETRQFQGGARACDRGAAPGDSIIRRDFMAQ
jgi:hypothetical protein